jgi:hypothetical protein
VKPLLNRIFRKIIREVVKRDSNLASVIEIDMKYSQGKSSGAGSTKLGAIPIPLYSEEDEYFSTTNFLAINSN